MRDDSRGLELPLHTAIFIDAFLLEDEDIVHADNVVLDPCNLGNLGDLPQPSAEARRLDDDIHSRGDLSLNDPDRQIVAGHADEHLETAQGLARVVGVDGREAAVMTGVHRLQHVERFRSPAFSDDDPVRPHAERVPHKIPGRYDALPFHVGRPRLHAGDVWLLQLEFCRVFNRDNSLFNRNVAGEHVQQSGLAGTGPARNDNVQPRANTGRQEFEQLGSRGLIGNQVRGQQRTLGKPANGDQRPVQGDGTQNGVHPAAIGEASVDHGTRFINPATDAARDPLHDLDEVIVVAEGHLRRFESPATLDIHRFGAVSHDVLDRRIAKQRLERPQPQRLIDDLVDQSISLGPGDQIGVIAAELLSAPPHLLTQCVVLEFTDDRRIDR